MVNPWRVAFIGLVERYGRVLGSVRTEVLERLKDGVNTDYKELANRVYKIVSKEDQWVSGNLKGDE